MTYKFADPKNSACISCVHVVKYSLPILYVSHDEDDGCWQFLCGQDHNESDAMIVGIGNIVKLDSSLNKIHDLSIGRVATRKSADDEWTLL